MKRIKWLATGLTFLGLLVFAVPQAGATVTGAVAFECTANLASGFPGSGNGTCSGTGVGLGAGADSATSPYVIVGPGSFNATFNYTEPCPVSGVPLPPALGTAVGSATVSGAEAVHNTALTTASLTTNFAWTRVGLVAVILTNGTNITFGNGGSATAAAPDAAVAAFAPIVTSGSHLCPAGDPLTAVVAGVDVQPA